MSKRANLPNIILVRSIIPPHRNQATKPRVVFDKYFVIMAAHPDAINIHPRRDENRPHFLERRFYGFNILSPKRDSPLTGLPEQPTANSKVTKTPGHNGAPVFLLALAFAPRNRLPKISMARSDSSSVKLNKLSSRFNSRA